MNLFRFSARVIHRYVFSHFVVVVVIVVVVVVVAFFIFFELLCSIRFLFVFGIQ